MGNGKILVVEDDFDIANMLRIYFNAQGFTVYVAGRGVEALQTCKEKLPDVVILDILLPDIDGYEVCERLRTHPRTLGIPIIFLTQKDERSDRIAGLERGADDYITKPFDIDELHLRVRNAIHRHHLKNTTDAITGLPSSEWIQKELKEWLPIESWTYLQIGIDHFDEYKDAFGFEAANDILRLMARILREVFEETNLPGECFVGHAGADTFVVISMAEKIGALMEQLKRKFTADSSEYYTLESQKHHDVALSDKRTPAVQLAIGAVSSQIQHFDNVQQIHNAGAEALRLARYPSQLQSAALGNVVEFREYLGGLTSWVILSIDVVGIEPWVQSHGNVMRLRIREVLVETLVSIRKVMEYPREHFAYVVDEVFLIISNVKDMFRLMGKLHEEFESGLEALLASAPRSPGAVSPEREPVRPRLLTNVVTVQHIPAVNADQLIEEVLTQHAERKRRDTPVAEHRLSNGEALASQVLSDAAQIAQEVRILFLAANPTDTDHLRLDQEIRAIDESLRHSDFPHRFVIQQQWAVRASDLQQAILRHKPAIVHFSGHGSQSSEIILEDVTGQAQPVAAGALKQLFQVLKGEIRCVVLNACYSERQAQAIAEHIDCVVGMTRAVGDAAAISFSAAFYQALGYGKAIKTAFDLGCIQIGLENLRDEDAPRLISRKQDCVNTTLFDAQV